VPERIVHEILRSRQNPRVQEARRLARDARLARDEGLFIADGTRVVQETLEAGIQPRVIFIDPDDPQADSIRAAASRCGARLNLVGPVILQAISTLTTAQGAIGIFERPRHELATLLAAPREDASLALAVFHQLQDPSNVGALIRTALAAGLTGAITTEGTCDPFHSRAVRASMGACLRLPLCTDQPASQLYETLKRAGFRLLALDPRGAVPLAEVRLDRPTALILGREGTGLDPDARAACDASVRIPMAPAVESLGVAAAGAIVFYALGMNRIS
jgi:RNA methyltransferase, TrmH family